ncbi:MAG TPA: sialate O-acetylesterase, partial [Phycisphaerae bacterium]|nr:sialate O-acetylesterase [Phycisphaerae bacterium]
VCSPQSVGNFSATGYYFGRELQPAIGVPLGLIHSSHGGTPAEAWMRAAALDEVAAMKPLLDAARAEADEWTSGRIMAAYNAELERWRAADTVSSDRAAANASFVPARAPHGVAFPHEPWKTINGGLVGEGAHNLLTTTAGLGAGDFTIRAQVTLDHVLESSAYFILGNSHFGFSDLTWGRLFTRGPIFGDKVAFVGRTTDFLHDGRPFDLELVRRGDTLTISIDGRKVHSVACGAGAIGVLGFCPGQRVMTVRDFSAHGTLVSPEAKTVAFARPVEPTDPRLRHFYPSVLFNGMIAPLLPVRLRGVIWYQGESNHERAVQYRALFPALIRSWRAEWREPDLPFLFVQIANFGKAEPEPSESDWAELREAQLLSLKIPHTAMAVTIDVGEGNDIHPKNKQAVGDRLARAARALVYGEDLACSSPIYRSMTVAGDSIRLSFDHVGAGLVAQGGPLRQFAIAGADRRFHWADARIEGDTVVVTSPDVPAPVAVRYAWAANPEGCNLYNQAGLPASPFRTDDWPLLSADRRTR